MSEPEIASWRKSTHSNPNGACIETGNGPGFLGFRDSRQDSGPVLRFRPEAFREFITRIKGQP